MNLKQRLAELVAACFTGLWVESHEHDDALAEIGQLCRDDGWKLATWDVAGGLRLPGTSGTAESATDALAAITNDGKFVIEEHEYSEVELEQVLATYRQRYQRSRAEAEMAMADASVRTVTPSIT